jgi:hypothetical protein
MRSSNATPRNPGHANVMARSAWGAAGDWAAYAEPELVKEYLYVPDQPYARVASAAEVTAVIDLATAVVDDPDAELVDAFEREGLPVRKIRGVRVVDGDFRNPRRVAAQVATLAGARCVVLARNATKATAVVRDGATLAITESAAPRWRARPAEVPAASDRPAGRGGRPATRRRTSAAPALRCGPCIVTPPDRLSADGSRLARCPAGVTGERRDPPSSPG